MWSIPVFSISHKIVMYLFWSKMNNEQLTKNLLSATSSITLKCEYAVVVDYVYSCVSWNKLTSMLITNSSSTPMLSSNSWLNKEFRFIIFKVYVLIFNIKESIVIWFSNCYRVIIPFSEYSINCAFCCKKLLWRS